MEVEIVEHEEDSASAGRGEGGADGCAHVRLAGTDVHEGEHPDVVEEARCAFSILVSISTEISCHAHH